MDTPVLPGRLALFVPSALPLHYLRVTSVPSALPPHYRCITSAFPLPLTDQSACALLLRDERY